MPNGGVQEWENFIAQTIESHKMASSFAWLLITRRDRRRAMVWMPWFALTALRGVGAFEGPMAKPFVRLRVSCRLISKQTETVDMCGMVLDDWLAGVSPENIRQLQKGTGHGEEVI